jgi:poly(3-hydroxybutyrate) depolymerase
MRAISAAGALAVAATLSVTSYAAAPVDDAFAAFWAAPTPAAAATAAADIAKSGVDFGTAFARLRAGRPYRADVPRGVQRLMRKSGATEFPYSLDVPAGYDPKKAYQVRVQLHGGVGRPAPGLRGDGSIGALAGAEQIYVLPQAWAGAEWWASAQDENLPAILDHVKRTYNVDENRVVVSGVSDGGTGAFYVAMRDTTPYASFLPLNGFILVLRNGDLGIAGALFPHNLTNKPVFSVNGGRDPLYPAARVEPVMAGFARGGLTHVYRPQPEAGHNTAWWPTVKDDFEAFVREHPRVPHPARLTWQTDSTTARNRAHWLVIDRLAPRREGDPLPDINDVVTGTEPSFGTRTAGMRVTEVVTGSNAQGMGLRGGDVVRAINGRDLPGGLDLEDFLGIFTAGDTLRFSVDRDGQRVELGGTYAPTPMPRVSPLFASGTPGGRVDLVREGNTVRATTRGVAAFTLLLSPDVIDFGRPVTVVADGRTVFEGRVQPHLDTLLTWAARDNDRTMLYGAALPIVLDGK